MLLSRSELENELAQKILDVTKIKNRDEELKEKLQVKYNISKFEATPYFSGTLSFSKLSNKELFWYTDVIDNSLVSKYYTANEINKYRGEKQATAVKENLYPIEMEVHKLGWNHWITYLDVNTLYSWYENQVVRYNTDTQRQMTFRNGRSIITLKKKKMEEIKNQLLDRTYVTDEMAFNLNVEEQGVLFHEGQNKLILEQGKLDIIDGWHRLSAIAAVMRQDPDFTYDLFPVNIFAYDNDQANAYIAQKSKSTPLSKNFVLAIDANNSVSEICKQINTAPNSFLRGNFSLQSRQAQLLANTLSQNYDLTDTRKRLQVSSFLIKLFNTLVLEREEQAVSEEDVLLASFVGTKTENVNEAYDLFVKMMPAIKKNLENSNKWLFQVRKRNSILEQIYTEVMGDE